VAAPAVTPVDPFDLPDWIGEEVVTWRAVSSLSGGHVVTGSLHGQVDQHYDCDVLACDLAYPVPVLSEAWRHDAHQAWTLGEVLAVSYNGRVTLVVPGTAVTAEPVLEAVRRLARAVGSRPDRFTVALRL